jgi:hypothetical protein
LHKASMDALDALKAEGKLTPKNAKFCREDFFRLAAEIIRRDVLDTIRSETARKKRESEVGEGRLETTNDGAQPPEAFESVVHALNALGQEDHQLATILTYHYGFGNREKVTMEKLSETLNLSKTKVCNCIREGELWIGKWLRVNAPDVL